MKRAILFIVFSQTFVFAQIKVKKPEVVFDLLIGTWQFGSNAEYEAWTKINHIYYAEVFSITNGDTTISEKCRIYKDHGKYYFEQKVVINNLSEASKFNLTALDERLMVFENRNLSFPQKIGYEWLPDNLLAVVQEGIVQGKLEFFEFSYKKIK